MIGGAHRDDGEDRVAAEIFVQVDNLLLEAVHRLRVLQQIHATIGGADGPAKIEIKLRRARVSNANLKRKREMPAAAWNDVA